MNGSGAHLKRLGIGPKLLADTPDGLPTFGEPSVRQGVASPCHAIHRLGVQRLSKIRDVAPHRAGAASGGAAQILQRTELAASVVKRAEDRRCGGCQAEPLAERHAQ